VFHRPSIKPPALRPGATIGVVAPAAALDRDHLDRGVDVLRSEGYRVVIAPHVLCKDRVLAGSDAQRAGDLMRMFADPAIGAIFAARGGYGAGRILPVLDYAAMATTPRIFVGYSDHTFLLNALWGRTGLICFHGPVVAKDLAQGVSADSLRHMWRLLAGELDSFKLEGRETIHPGQAQGPLIGGCLSILVAMLGTPYAPLFAGAILLLEDTGERAYRIDRMLVQLRQAGALQQVAGIVVGGMKAPGGSASEQELISQFLAEQTGDLGVPVLGGIEAGHGTANFTLPIGAQVRLDATGRRLEILECPVSRG
jgi:muramoyltetrapeptide carboxypeptidase